MGNKAVGIVFVILAIIAYLVIKSVGDDRVEGQKRVTVKIEDAGGIPLDSPVYMAGLPIGYVERRELSGNYAMLVLRVDEGIALGQDARLIKRTPSLLAAPVLELDPGHPDVSGPMPEGGEILRVEEDTSHVLRSIEEKLPGFTEGAEDLRAAADRWSIRVRGEFADRVYELLAGTNEFSEDASARLGGINDWLGGLGPFDFDAEEEIGGRLDTAQEWSATAKDWTSDATADVQRIGDEAQADIRDFDIRENEDLVEYIDTVRGIDRGDSGTLGELVNDPELAHDIEDATRGLRNFVDGVTGWRMLVGLRNEYNFESGIPRFYVTLRAQRRPGTYYYLEVEKGGRGGDPEVSLVWDPSLGRFRRDIRIEEKIRFTAQYAKELGPFTVRGGIKESTFGAGVDLRLGDRLELSADLFDLEFDERPRLKVAAAYRFFGHLYVLGGVDDALNDGRLYDIEPLGDDVPIQFEELYVGRDFFLGGELRFTDRDLASLIRVGGAALAGTVD